ncbi:MAG: RNA polymerase sigma factor [Chthonomonadales bacterium]
MINLFRVRGLSDQLVAEATDASAASADAFFAELVDACYRRTYRLIYRMVRNEGDAADLTQETFVRVYRALPRLRAQGAAASWVRKIAINLCLDHIRRRRAAPVVASIDAPYGPEGDPCGHLELADPAAEPDRILDASESSRLIHAAIDALPPDYRAVIVLHHVEEMRVEEIADLFGVPVGTIKSRLSRARKALQRRLAPYFSP